MPHRRSAFTSRLTAEKKQIEDASNLGLRISVTKIVSLILPPDSALTISSLFSSSQVGRVATRRPAN
jgi:hypothetical protein